jgi:iron complex transport system substrate-binding protein
MLKSSKLLCAVKSILLASTLFMISCGGEEQAEPASEPITDPAGSQILTDQHDHTHSVVSLGGTLTEIVYALGRGNWIVGSDFSSLYPPEAQETPKVGIWRSVTPESVIGLEPEIVVAMPDAGPESTLEQIKMAGIKLYQPNDNYSIQWTKGVISDMAEVLEAPNKAQQLISTMDAQMDQYLELKDRFLEQGGKSAMFVYVKGGKAFLIAGDGTTADAMITEAGLTNVAHELEEWANVGPEYTSTKNPDFVIITEAGIKSIGGIEALQSTPGIGEMLAVKEGRVHQVDELSFLGYGPRVIQQQMGLIEYAMGLDNN